MLRNDIKHFPPIVANFSGNDAGLFQENLVNNMEHHNLAPYVVLPRATVVFDIWDKQSLVENQKRGLN